MGETGTREPTYLSVYRHGVDEKRRLQIPSKWRSKEPEQELTLVLWPEEYEKHACLMAFPPRVIWQIIESLNQMPFTDRETNAIRRSIGERSDTATVDKGGRICIPEWMAKAIQVDKECVMVGLMDRFQIWNPKRYEVSQPVNEGIATNSWQKVFGMRKSS